MFGRNDRNAQRLKEVEARLAAAEAELTRLRKAPVLLSLNRENKRLRWIFFRNGEQIVIESYSTMQDNLPKWKQELGV